MNNFKQIVATLVICFLMSLGTVAHAQKGDKKPPPPKDKIVVDAPEKKPPPRDDGKKNDDKKGRP